MFKFWRKDTDTGEEVAETEPYGLRVGAVVEVETLELRILADKLMFDLSFPTQRIEKISHITLDDGVIMHRYYGGEVMFQITTIDGSIDQVQMFEEIHELHPDDWTEWLGKDGHIGAKTFEIDEVEFQRAWQEEPQGAVSPMELEEEFDGTDKFYEHKCMMYARWLDDNSESVEWLLVTAEDRGKSGSVKFLLGVDLDPSQFRVTA